MVRDAAEVAGAGVGAEGFLAGAVRGEEEGRAEDGHGGMPEGIGHKSKVYEFPLAVVLDGAKSLLVERQGKVLQRQEVICRRIRGVVEIPNGNNPVNAGAEEGIGQKGQTFHRPEPAGFRRRAAVLGRMVVHQNDKVPAGADEMSHEDVPGGHHGGIGIEDMAGTGVKEAAAGPAVQEGDVNAAGVRGIVVNDGIIGLTERSCLKEPAEDEPVLNLGKSNHVREAAHLAAGPEDGLGHGVTLGTEPFPGPASFPEGRKLTVRDTCGVVPIVKEVLKVPEHNPFLRRRHRTSHQQQTKHPSFHDRC